jgi:hypothetical protein
VILPIVLFISASALKEIQGPYYLFFYDPSYVYLINSLNLAQLSGYGVGHFDHPGTPVQVIGAAVVKVIYLLTSKEADIAVDVLTRPESYLYAMNKTFAVLNCIGLFLLGLFTLRITKSLFLSLLIQISPFVSMELFFGLIICTPENLLIFVSMTYIGAMIYYLYNDNLNGKMPLSFLIAMAVICGLGLATKISFFPLLVFPLIIISGFKRKLLFTLLTFVSFILFILPGLSNYEYFLNWISELILKSGKYGKGEATVINSGTFFNNLLLIFSKDKLFSLSYLVSVFALFLLLRKSNSSSAISHIKQKKILISLVTIFSLQIIIVAKHYAQYYMIPSFMLSVFALIISAYVIAGTSFDKVYEKRFKYAISLMGLLIFSWSLIQIVSSYYEGDAQRKDALEMVNLIEQNRKGALVISSFGSSSSECALAFSSQYAAGQSSRYRDILAGKSESKIFYNQWIDQFYCLTGQQDVRSTLLNSRNILLQLSHYGNIENFVNTTKSVCGVQNVTYEKIFSNQKKETLYRIFINK